jgi:two-component system, OmpR family, sensor kinase
MKLFHSIRWRLQFWHGVLWVVVLAGFGTVAWRLEHKALLMQLDDDIEKRLSVIEAAIRTVTERAHVSPPPPPEPTDLSAYEEGLFDENPYGAFYYMIWRHDGLRVAYSDTAPPDIPKPERIPGVANVRIRGDFRERYWFTPRGECALVGRPVGFIAAATRRLAWTLAATGGFVLALGLAGGFWVTGRALRPIADIGAVAAQIAQGDLSRRVKTTDYESELGQLAELLNSMFARLEAAFERQSRFTADAAHELRTPVAILLTHAQNALAAECPAPEHRQALEAIERAAQRMRRIVEALLQLARLDAKAESIRRAPCDLAAIVRECLKLLSPLSQARGLRLETDLKPAPCAGDPDLLHQAAMVLLTNALQHNHDGGEIVVRTSGSETFAALEIANTGPGISPENLPHLFNRFYRADASRAGTHSGLGISIAKAIADAHQATLTAASPPGEPTVFRLTIHQPES